MNNNILSNHSRLTVIAVAAALALAGSALADNGSAGTENGLHTGSWSFQFQIEDDFTLKSFQGALFSCKYHLSDKTALRLGASVSLMVNDIFDDNVSQIEDSLIAKMTGDREYESYGFGVSLLYTRYPNPARDLTAFWGIGPSIGYSRDESLQKMKDYYHSGFLGTSRSVLKQWLVGLKGILGVEWFFHKNISLLAEYGFSISRLWSESESRRQRSDRDIVTSSTSDGDTWDFDAEAVKLGLSVYF